MVAIEVSSTYVAHLERAIMAIRFSDEIFGTQFHQKQILWNDGKPERPETNKSDDRKFGLEKYHETLDRIDDEDKIVLTQAQILPRFLQHAMKSSKK